MGFGKKTTVEAGALRLPIGRWAGEEARFSFVLFCLMEIFMWFYIWK